MRIVPLIVAAALLLVSVEDAHAGVPDPTVQLEYTRGPGAEHCPDEHAVRDYLIGDFGYDPVQPDASTTLKISVTRIQRELRVMLVLEDSEGNVLWEEGFDEADCGTLIRHSALKAYINTKSIFGWPSAPPAASPAPAPPAAPAAAAPAAPAPSRAAAPPGQSSVPAPPAPVSPDRLRFVVGLQALVHLGITPKASAGGAVLAEARWRNLGLGVEGRAVRSVIPAELNGASVQIFFGAVTVAPCYHQGFFMACAVFDVGALQASGGVDAEVGSPEVVAIGARPGVEWPFTERFAFRGTLEVSGVLTKTSLRVDNLDAWQTPDVFVAFGAGVTATF